MLKVVFALSVLVAFVGVFATPTAAVTCFPGNYRSNGACLPCAAGTFTTLRNAASCKTHKTCQKGQFVKKQPTPTSDRLCAFCASVGKFSNTVNAPSCTAYTVCPAVVKQLQRPNPTSDRVCQPLPQWVTTVSDCVFPIVNTPYSFTLQAVSMSYLNVQGTYSVVGGTLPVGIALNTINGVLSGISTDTTARNVTFRATSAVGTFTDFTVPFYSAIQRPVWSTTANAVLYPISGSAYTLTLSATDSNLPGSRPQYAIVSGTLPTGLTLDPINGVISGTTTDTVARTVVVSAITALGRASSDLTLVQFKALVQQPLIHFNAVGTTTWTVPVGINRVNVLVVGGGGAGSIDHGGGGGAGGVVYVPYLVVTPSSSYSVTVGAGGVGVRGSHIICSPAQGGRTSRPYPPAQSGSPSSFGSYTANGGGGGSGFAYDGTGAPGGCGGGAGTLASGAGGASTQLSYSGASTFGTAGGTSGSATGAGGGGAGSPGNAGSGNNTGNGGVGVTIFGMHFAGGGGGGKHVTVPSGTASFGGGAGSPGTGLTDALNGKPNTGGGGGGTNNNVADIAANGLKAGNGGSGTVILQYYA